MVCHGLDLVFLSFPFCALCWSDVLVAHSAEWQLDAVRSLAAVLTPQDAGPTLGVVTGSVEVVKSQLEKKQRVVQAMQSRVAICRDVQAEHVLNRQSLGVSRVTHILRVHGRRLQQAGALAQFDQMTSGEMDRLFPGLTEESHEQATLGAAWGGLGWRRASDVALPANLAALVTAAPMVRDMAAAAVHAGLLPAGVVEGRLDAEIRMTQDAYLATLHDQERSKAEEFISEATAAAVAQWQRLRQGQGVAARAPRARAEYAGPNEHAPLLIPNVHDGGASDIEGAARRLSSQHVQRELAKLGDSTRLRLLEAKLRQQCNWPQLDRLRELRHPEVSHMWLWHLNSREGSVLTEPDYVANIQKRLGAKLREGCDLCHLCGAPLDAQLEHSELCPIAEATRGHYACVRSLVAGFRLADPNVTTEPAGLTSTLDRPADILTTAAVPGRSAAIDVCVASRNTSVAAGDAAAAAFRRKLRRYRRAIPELRRAGIVFRPMVWTADARPHPAVVRTLRRAAAVAASRNADSDSAPLVLNRWRHEITIAILRRRAAMSRAVLPRRSARQRWLLSGQTSLPPSSDIRAPQLDDDDDDADDDVEPEPWSERAPRAQAVGAAAASEDMDAESAGEDVDVTGDAAENGVDVEMAVSGEGAEAAPPSAPVGG